MAPKPAKRPWGFKSVGLRFVTEPLPPRANAVVGLGLEAPYKRRVRVTHIGDEHLVCLSSDEVALLVDLCHAATFSEMLSHTAEDQRRQQRFMAEVQASLFDTAQEVWLKRRRQPLPVD